MLGICLTLGAQAPSSTDAPRIDKPKPKEAPPKPPIAMVQTGYEMEDAFPDLKFDQPLDIVSVPGDKDRLFVVEKTGRVLIISGLNGAKAEKKLFLDLTHPRDGALEAEGECGVLGLAFPEDHRKSGRFFVYYSLKIDGKLNQRLSRFQVSADAPDHADPATEQPLFTQLDPASNHNGGDLHFGPDGYLYVSVGDGGAADDRFDTARFINKGFFASILRIDVDKRKGNLPPNAHPGVALDASGAAYYSIPKDNPFVGATSYHDLPVDPKTVRTEIWATGLRNPWRFSFDPPTGRLFAGDVGQNIYEEVDLIVKGGDYGWSYREGLHAFSQGPGGTKEPKGFNPVLPIFEYPHPMIGISVTGGAVYHGSKFPEHMGKYLFADYGTGRVMALRDEGKPVWVDEALAFEGGIVSIAPDPRNSELLFANIALGKIRTLKQKTALAKTTTLPLKRKVDVLGLIRSGAVEYHINPKQDFHDDPAQVWTFQSDGTLHISGRGYGYVATKEAFKDYHLVLEYKWGEKTWGHRENSARDNGLLLHARGPHGAYGDTWMASIECQIIEGGSGDILVLSPKLADGSELTSSISSEFVSRGKARVWKKGEPRQVVTKGRIDWEKRDVDWVDQKGFRGRDDVDKPVGEWNQMEVFAQGDTLRYVLNGVLVNEAFEVKPSEGRVLLQTEGAEMLVRRLELLPLEASGRP